MITIQIYDNSDLIKEIDFQDHLKAKEFIQKLKEDGHSLSYENKRGKTYSVWNDEWDNYQPTYRESYEPSRFNYNNCLQ